VYFYSRYQLPSEALSPPATVSLPIEAPVEDIERVEVAASAPIEAPVVVEQVPEPV